MPSQSAYVGVSQSRRFFCRFIIMTRNHRHVGEFPCSFTVSWRVYSLLGLGAERFGRRETRQQWTLLGRTAFGAKLRHCERRKPETDAPTCKTFQNSTLLSSGPKIVLDSIHLSVSHNYLPFEFPKLKLTCVFSPFKHLSLSLSTSLHIYLLPLYLFPSSFFRAGKLGFDSRQDRIFLFPTTSTPVLWPNQSPIRCLPGPFTWG
jgi:hypothetical protein